MGTSLFLGGKKHEHKASEWLRDTPVDEFVGDNAVRMGIIIHSMSNGIGLSTGLSSWKSFLDQPGFNGMWANARRFNSWLEGGG